MARTQPALALITLLPFVNKALAAIGPVADLVITNEDVSPDGFTRGAVLAGGNTIGPLIVGNKASGDNIQINLINNLNDSTMLQSTSIVRVLLYNLDVQIQPILQHWHGFFQKTTNWDDGVAFVNQCPIAKGDSFLYDFNVPDQAGTFWYHSHLSTQYCDGLRGPLVIYDPNDPHQDLYDVDDESTVITLADWYHSKAKTIVFGTPDSTLINGLGRWSEGNATDLAVITVTQGKRYRMRLVNVACDPAYTFSIDNHTMTIIETETVNNVPLEVDSLMIYVAQRYSFVLNADQPIGNYWIRANPNAGTLGFTNGINSAILRYVGAEEAEPPTLNITSTNPLNQSALVPLDTPGVPGDPVVGGVDVAMHLEFAFTSAAKFTVNGAEYIPPTVPVLLQILSGAQTVDSLLPTGSVISLPRNASVELSFTGGLLGLDHPIHLHGHTFDVVRAAGASEYNFVNPIRRDVVNAGATSDNVTIRFRTDNPGPWIMHCHIDWHLENGFAVVFAEASDAWNSTIDPTGPLAFMTPAFYGPDSGYRDSAPEEYRSMVTFQRCFDEFLGSIAQIEEQNTIPLMMEHPYLILPCAIVSGAKYAPGAEVQLTDPSLQVYAHTEKINHTILPDSFFFNISHPIITIRHPALMLPSWIRSMALIGKPLHGEWFVHSMEVMASYRWERLIYESYTSAGRRVTVIDGEKLVRNTKEQIRRVCEVIGVDEGGVAYTWEALERENGPWDKSRVYSHLPEYMRKAFLGTIHRSTGVILDKIYNDLDLGEEKRKWVLEWDVDLADNIEEVVRASLEDYEYLLGFCI
ncbi:laccase, multicopper oxidase, benzenediol:oxygen oxidorectuctase [Paramarasmius palmivorus]|uniref:Laccase, multicopper oxidase, benzenediol:oxygen oxidorectuctase n=1 Tax=Paramarasmius palmivorus TaxID=297713 RepID=A0AAW0D0Q9_9AGAR